MFRASLFIVNQNREEDLAILHLVSGQRSVHTVDCYSLANKNDGLLMNVTALINLKFVT